MKTIFLNLIPFLAFGLLLLFCYSICKNISFENPEDEEQVESETQNANNTSRTLDLANLTEKEKETRRFHILNSLIIKRVVSNPEMNKDVGLYKDEQKHINHVHNSKHKLPSNMNNSNHSFNSLASSLHNKSNHKSIRYVKSKHRMNDSTHSVNSLSGHNRSLHRSISHAFSRNMLRDRIDSTNSLSSSTHSQNIFVSSLSTLSLSGLRDKISRKKTQEVHVLSGTCGICLCKFEKGEEICWSPNKLCKHSFHKECVLEWLMKHNDCPICRNDFLVDNDSDSIVDSISSQNANVITCHEDEEYISVEVPLQEIQEDAVSMDDVGLDIELGTSRHSQAPNNSIHVKSMMGSFMVNSNFESSCEPTNQSSNESNIVCEEGNNDQLVPKDQTHINDVELDIET